MENKKVSSLRRSWRTVLIFILNFLPEYMQLNIALRLISKDIIYIIEQEDKYFMRPHQTLQAKIYMDAYIEMVKLLYVEGNNKACAKAFSLMASILDTQQFNRHLFDVSDMLIEYHPRYIEYMNEVRRESKYAR